MRTTLDILQKAAAEQATFLSNLMLHQLPCHSTPTTNTTTANAMDKASSNLHQFSVIYTNIQGLYPNSNNFKIPYYLEAMATEAVTIICLTETQLPPAVMDAETKIKGFKSQN